LSLMSFPGRKGTRRSPIRNNEFRINFSKKDSLH
jgi:hypothetical protein